MVGSGAMPLMRIQDDAGDWIAPATMRRMLRASAVPDPAARADLRRRVVRPVLVSIGVFTAVLLALALIVALLASATGARIFGLIFHTPAQAAAISTAIGLAGLARLGVRAHLARVERHTLRLSLCPACLYGLAGVRPQRNLVRCPECSARWRAPRVGAQHPDSDPPRVVPSHAEPATTSPPQTTAAIGGSPSP